jgi:hypothetical protein
MKIDHQSYFEPIIHDPVKNITAHFFNGRLKKILKNHQEGLKVAYSNRKKVGPGRK